MVCLAVPLLFHPVQKEETETPSQSLRAEKPGNTHFISHRQPLNREHRYVI